MYAFDPVTIFQNELFAGQTVTIPTSVQDNLNRVKTASRWMFALYITGVCLSFVTFLIGLTSLYSRVGSCCTTIVAFMAFLFVGAATILAQVLFLIYRNVINNASISNFNVSASLGTTIFIFSWIATAGSLLAFVGYMFGICCGTGSRYERVPRRKRGEKPVDESSYPLARNQFP